MIFGLVLDVELIGNLKLLNKMGFKKIETNKYKIFKQYIFALAKYVNTIMSPEHFSVLTNLD